MAGILLLPTLLPWGRVPHWTESPLGLPGCLVGQLALLSTCVYHSSNPGGYRYALEIWTQILRLAEWVSLPTQPPHQLSVFLCAVFFYHRVLFLSLLHLLLLLLLLRSSWMLFSALASAQLLLFSIPVGLFYFFAFFPLFYLPSSLPKPDISQDFPLSHGIYILKTWTACWILKIPQEYSISGCTAFTKLIQIPIDQLFNGTDKVCVSHWYRKHSGSDCVS